MKLIRNFRLRRIHAFLLGAVAAYCTMQITSYVTTPAALRFSFESYQNGTDATDRLLHLFPIGSNADVFLNFMNKTGANVESITESHAVWNYIEPRSFAIFTAMQWNITIYFDPQTRKIEKLSAWKHVTGL
jgi:hypothetical protein